jgi:hypothetical protein
VAVLLYLLISCVTLAAALGRRAPPRSWWLYAAGIALIVLSDTLIAFAEFLGQHRGDSLILPTYYLAHLCVTASVRVHDPDGPPARPAPA